MADTDSKQGLSGRDLQESQSGGESGAFGGNMQQQQAAGMVGGGPGASDASPAGGSSGTGGYGKSQNAQLHQGQGSSPPGLAGGAPHGHGGLSRGEAYDEQLQRQQQEKALFRDFAPNSGGGLLGRARRHAEPEAGTEGGKG